MKKSTERCWVTEERHEGGKHWETKQGEKDKQQGTKVEVSGHGWTGEREGKEAVHQNYPPRAASGPRRASVCRMGSVLSVGMVSYLSLSVQKLNKN